MKTISPTRALAVLIAAAAVALAGCAHDRATASRRPPRDAGQPTVYTGSRIPQSRNRVTAAPLSANTPPESVSRHPDSLVPTEPVVGATDNTTR